MILRLFTFFGLFLFLLTFNFTDVSAKDAAVGQKKIVVTFSILEDIVSVIGKKRVHVTSLVRRNMDSHMFRPTPRQAKIVSSADLVVMNGLGFEGWIKRLVKASGYKGKILIASENIPKIKFEKEHHGHKKEHHGHEKEHHGHKKEHHGHEKEHHGHGEWDPHVWLSVPNMKIYVSNVAEGMSRMDPSWKAYYMKNLKKYMADLDNLDKYIRRSVNSIPKKNRRLITSHEAFGHLSNEYGLEMLSPQGLSTETRASASRIASIVRFIKKNSVKALFPENITDNRLIQQIAKQTNIKIGSSLYSDALSEKNGPAGTYLNYMRYNIETIVNVLK